ncbi:MAG: hypothetical protein RL701_7332, partial [Pseudomonadota bacterium]
MDEADNARVGSVLLQRYRIDAVLGRGGMSTVYRGVQLSVKRPVAIKLIAGNLARDPECVLRFRREAEAMARLQHPNTVRIYEFGVTEQDELFIVMELLEGQDLAERIVEQGTLPVPEALSITRQALESLCEAHGLGIVHRDLKPANIFLSRLPRGQVLAKVMDFGIADIDPHPERTRLTRNGVMIGTPAYMSPEQVMGQSVDARSDLYTLGIILYEMLVGKTPFEDQPTASILLAQMSTAPRPLAQARPELQHAPELQVFLDGLLAKQAHERPASAEATLALIETLPRIEPAGATPRPATVEPVTRLRTGLLPAGIARATLTQFTLLTRPGPARQRIFVGAGVAVVLLLGLVTWRAKHA